MRLIRFAPALLLVAFAAACSSESIVAPDLAPIAPTYQLAPGSPDDDDVNSNPTDPPPCSGEWETVDLGGGVVVVQCVSPYNGSGG
jgi:hypothetical protein